jgi:hypothetical protein
MGGDAVNDLTKWYQQLLPAQKGDVKAVAKKMKDKIDGLPDRCFVSYSLVKKPVSNWSMCLGEQFQMNHRWQIRTEAGFLGGRKSLLLSGNYRLGL